MKTEKISFASSDHEHTIKANVYLPDEGEPSAVLQIVHGMNEYKERYEPFATYMTDHGFAVAVDDHLGHGESINDVNDLGYFGEKNGDKYLTEDEHLLYQAVRQRFPDQPYFLLGHSMGSFITRNYVASFEDQLDGYICMGTRGRMAGTRAASVIADQVAHRRGSHYRSEILDQMAKNGYNDHFEAENDSMSWLSKDLENRHAFADDERSDFIFTAAGFKTLSDLINSVTGRQWARRIRKDLPILVVSGGEDPVGDYGKGPKEVAAWLRDAGLTDVTLKIFPHDRHEILNELDKDEVYDYILDWIRKIERKEGFTKQAEEQR